MVLLSSAFPVLQETPCHEGERHDEAGGYKGVREREENPALRRVSKIHETLPNPRLVTSFAHAACVRMVREGKTSTRETRDMRRYMSDAIDFVGPSRAREWNVPGSETSEPAAARERGLV